MELMTASPGVLYNVEGVFRNGPIKGKIFPGFNLDTRKPLAENLKSTTAAIYSPKLTSKVRGFEHYYCSAVRLKEHGSAFLLVKSSGQTRIKYVSAGSFGWYEK